MTWTYPRWASRGWRCGKERPESRARCAQTETVPAQRTDASLYLQVRHGAGRQRRRGGELLGLLATLHQSADRLPGEPTLILAVHAVIGAHENAPATPITREMAPDPSDTRRPFVPDQSRHNLKALIIPDTVWYLSLGRYAVALQITWPSLGCALATDSGSLSAPLGSLPVRVNSRMRPRE